MPPAGSTGKMPAPRMELVDEVARMVGGLPGVRQGKMYGCPAFYAGKKLFACVYGDGLAVKVPAEQVESLLGAEGYARFEPMGRKMREWVIITLSDLDSYRGLEGLLTESARYVASLAEDG